MIEEDTEGMMAVNNDGSKNCESTTNDKIDSNNINQPIANIEHFENNEKKNMLSENSEKQRKFIKSVTQKLKRETTSIPYHRPKTFTLKEFMTRKTVVKSKFLCNNTVLQQVNHQINIAKPKMNCEQLEKYSKYLENRIKEVTKFFKSEVTNDENEKDCNTDNIVNEDNSGSDLTIKKYKSDISLPILTNFEIKEENIKPLIDLDDKQNILKALLTHAEIVKKSNITKKFEVKPGNSHIKLRKDLKRLITQKRKKEIEKKIEDNKKKIHKTIKYRDEKQNEENYETENEEIEKYSDNNDSNESIEDIEIDYNEEEIIDKNDLNVENNGQMNEITENENISNIDKIEGEVQSIDIDKLNLCPSFNRESSNENEIFISRIPNSTLISEDEENELENLCSGTFSISTKKETSPLSNQNINLKSSEDKESDIMPSSREKRTMTKKRRRFVISDDSESDDSDNESEINLKRDSKQNQSEIEEDYETYIDYDSEENEIEVKLTKSDRLEKAEGFLEKEAELSDSEWDSADEDEKDLDKYDIELGDEDDFDAEQLRDEIGKIHMRKLLNEDIREVKKIQEMFFDDEENDGIGRQRQFKWKNINDNDFVSIDYGDQTRQVTEAIIVNDDEHDEEVYRKTRYEREQLLREKIDGKISQEETEKKLDLQIIGKKLTVIKPKVYTPSNAIAIGLEKNSQPQTSKIEKRVMRRSFLERDQETLSKLSSLTNIDVENEISCMKSVRNNRNFVFPILFEGDRN